MLTNNPKHPYIYLTKLALYYTIWFISPKKLFVVKIMAFLHLSITIDEFPTDLTTNPQIFSTSASGTTLHSCVYGKCHQ
ncbi:hypothetical protein MXB_2808 [Myxobolus squamalis]|nr:hypothetical protein MXB_2808 [Myxobolus squamalis]